MRIGSKDVGELGGGRVAETGVDDVRERGVLDGEEEKRRRSIEMEKDGRIEVVNHDESFEE